jgi:hypothetical protein
MDKTKIEHHINHLQEKHKGIDKRLKPETSHHIARVLKKEKLQLKDEIERLKKQIQ